ncbi:unnamed protein product [Closterium sp. Yama58-4]|nr:unnamed protein product [Closterium sp. Yama58-4]
MAAPSPTPSPPLPTPPPPASHSPPSPSPPSPSPTTPLPPARTFHQQIPSSLPQAKPAKEEARRLRLLELQGELRLVQEQLQMLQSQSKGKRPHPSDHHHRQRPPPSRSMQASRSKGRVPGAIGSGSSGDGGGCGEGDERGLEGIESSGGSSRVLQQPVVAAPRRAMVHQDGDSPSARLPHGHSASGGSSGESPEGSPGVRGSGGSSRAGSSRAGGSSRSPGAAGGGGSSASGLAASLLQGGIGRAAAGGVVREEPLRCCLASLSLPWESLAFDLLFKEMPVKNTVRLESAINGPIVTSADISTGVADAALTFPESSSTDETLIVPATDYIKHRTNPDGSILKLHIREQKPSPDEVLLYNSLQVGHEVYEVGDSVLLRSCRSDCDVVFIRQIRVNPDGGLEVKGQWLYREQLLPFSQEHGRSSVEARATTTDELFGNIKRTSVPSDPRRLFYSFHYESFVPETIVRKCSVVVIPPSKALPSTSELSDFVVSHVYDVQGHRLLTVTDKSLPREHHDELATALARSKEKWESYVEHTPRELQESNKVNLVCSSSNKRSAKCSELSWNVPGSKRRKLSTEGKCLAVAGGLIRCDQAAKEIEAPEDHSSVSGGCCKPSLPVPSVTDHLSHVDTYLEVCDKADAGCSITASTVDVRTGATGLAEDPEGFLEAVEVHDFDEKLVEQSTTPVDVQHLVELLCPNCGVCGTVPNSPSENSSNEIEEHKLECTTCGHSWVSLLDSGNAADAGHDDLEFHGLECQEESNAVGSESDADDENDPLLFIKRLPLLTYAIPENRPCILPPRKSDAPPVTLVLDLDETLVHSTMDFCPFSDFNFPVLLNSHTHMVHVRKRPHVETFLQKVAELFEVVVFTASQGIYADKLLDIIDPKTELVQHRIFRESCVYIEGNYVKDLSVLGRDLAKVVIVDNSPQAFGLQVDNGIPIEAWFDDDKDCELQLLLPFLETLARADDVRPHITERFKLQERINKIPN